MEETSDCGEGVQYEQLGESIAGTREFRRAEVKTLVILKKEQGAPYGWVELEGTGNQVREAVQDALDHDKDFGMCPLCDGKPLEADE